jgi:multiple sugar transport system ATP-binding protein
VEATVSDGNVSFAGWELRLDPARCPSGDGRVVLGVRPEAFEDAALADGVLPTVDVVVSVVEDLGSDSHVIFPIDAPRVETEELRAAADREEEALLADNRSMWNARVSSKADVAPGRRIRLAVDPAELYFFDPETGASLTADAPARAAVG